MTRTQQNKTVAGPQSVAAKAVPINGNLVFSLVMGLFLFLVIVKVSSPVILDSKIDPPQGVGEAFYYEWPPHWGFWMFPAAALAGLASIGFKQVRFHWALLLPAVWFFWELVASGETISPPLTQLTMRHFAICVGLFYLGVFRRQEAYSWPLWVGIGLALCWAMRAGMEQHFGGLEATRKMILESPDKSGLDARLLASPEFMKRMAGGRIFGTFGGYPNSFAGGIELFLPVTLVFVWRLTPKVRTRIRVLFVLILGGCGMACLYWSGSKTGWWVALLMGLIALGHSKLALKWKLWVISAVLVAGVIGFGVKYAAFFKKDRNSVGARFAYWKAARIIALRHPLFGTGPGTFQIPFEQIKNPEDEVARLCHNDYLEQACDSGIFGFVSYIWMVSAVIFILYRYSVVNGPVDWLKMSIWMGLFGLAVHSILDFHLYVPALAWPWFYLSGWSFKRDN